MARATLQPPAGACGEMTGLLMMRAYHEDRGDHRAPGADPGLGPRHEPGQRAPGRVRGRDGARPTPAASSTWGRSAKLVDDSVAGLMLTNPNTLGLFEERDRRDRRRDPRRRAGSCYYDGANLNAIIGPLPARRHGVRHRAHQHAQDVRDAARGRRAGRGARRRGGRARRRTCPGPSVERSDDGSSRSIPAGSGRSAGCTGSTATSGSWCARTPTCSCTAPTG